MPSSRILILNYEYPPIGGGAGVISHYHAKNIAESGHKTTVITTWFKGEKELETTGNLTIIKLKSKRRYDYKSTPDEWLSWMKNAKRFLKNFLTKNPHDFCIANFALPSGEVARYLKRHFGLRYAVVSHGQDIPWFFPKQMLKYHIATYLWIKKICNHCDNLVLQTNAMKKNADRFMRRDKHKNLIVPNGCETKNFYPDYDKRNKPFKIIFAGRLVAQKAPFVFLKALLEFKQNIDNEFIVNILGDGDLKAKMQKFVNQNGLNQNVKFKGWVSKQEMLAEYQSAHVQVMSSAAEAMSVSALESLASGLYLISTPVSGNTDIITEGINGNLFPYGNSKALAKLLLDFYNTKFKNNYQVPKPFLDDFRKNYEWRNVVNSLIEKLNLENI